MSHAPALQEAAQPAVRELARRLLANGASPELARRVVERVASRGSSGEPEHPLDAAAAELGAAFPRFELPMPKDAVTGLALLGVRRAGRSALARKLALRFRARDLRPAVIALDQAGATTPQWLASWLQEAGVPAVVAGASASFPFDALGGARVLVLDGSGDLRGDARTVLRFERETRGVVRWRRVGVLGADASIGRLSAEARALRAVGAECAVLTRVDAAVAPAAALEACAAHRLPVAFLCDGPGDDGHLRRLVPDLAADVFLRGRAA
ncbi:MAG: hypothetical protein JNK02_08080 [Planctomycetes bacterium]|nr:hypothetical protein [Planctomycetota bacterium]